MDDFVLARVIHVLSVVLWIGGVAFVTLVLLPGMKTVQPLAPGPNSFSGWKAAFPGRPA